MIPSETTGFAFACPLKTGLPCVMSREEGKKLVFYSLDPIRGKGEQLGKLEADLEPFYDWAISPDGSRLAAIDKSHKGRIEVLTLSDHVWDEIVVDPEWQHLQSIAWTVDGKGFFATCWSPDSFNLLRVTLAGKVEPLLRKGRSQWFWGPRPSPDGKYLAFDGQTWDSNVWLIERP